MRTTRPSQFRSVRNHNAGFRADYKQPGWGYSEELGDWRYYPGAAISAEPGAEVKAAGSGVIAGFGTRVSAW